MKTESKILNKSFEFETRHNGLVANNEWMHDSWIVTINGKQFDYSTGIGHRERIKNRFKFDRIKGIDNPMNIKNAWNNRLIDKGIQAKIIDATSKAVSPSLDNVLYSLVSDAGFGLYEYEDFCLELGYDTDSIKAKKAHESCRDTYFSLLALGIDIESAQDAFCDY